MKLPIDGLTEKELTAVVESFVKIRHHLSGGQALVDAVTKYISGDMTARDVKNVTVAIGYLGRNSGAGYATIVTDALHIAQQCNVTTAAARVNIILTLGSSGLCRDDLRYGQVMKLIRWSLKYIPAMHAMGECLQMIKAFGQEFLEDDNWGPCCDAVQGLCDLGMLIKTDVARVARLLVVACEHPCDLTLVRYAKLLLGALYRTKTNGTSMMELLERLVGGERSLFVWYIQQLVTPGMTKDAIQRKIAGFPRAKKAGGHGYCGTLLSIPYYKATVNANTQMLPANARGEFSNETIEGVASQLATDLQYARLHKKAYYMESPLTA